MEVIMDDSPKGSYFLIALMFFNAIGTASMYFMTLLLGKHSETFNVIRASAYAMADFPFTIIPLFFAAYGLYKRTLWGWVLSLMVAAVYLHSMTVLMVEDLQTVVGPMFYMDFYFIAFAVFCVFYLINNRHFYLNKKVVS